MENPMKLFKDDQRWPYPRSDQLKFARENFLQEHNPKVQTFFQPDLLIIVLCLSWSETSQLPTSAGSVMCRISFEMGCVAVTENAKN